MVDVNYYRELLATSVRGRRLILAGVPVAAATQWVKTQRELGAERCLIVAPSIGTGTLPDEADADWVDLGIDAHDTTEEFRSFERAMTDLPVHVTDALDRFDPDRSALTYVSAVQAVMSVAGRPAYGARRPEWVALEDKAIIDKFFDDVGIPHPPSAVVPAQRDALLSAATRLASSQGTVWSGDAREGFNGGAVLVRWVRSAEDADQAVPFLQNRCDRVRIAPFVEGIPCNIQGLVLNDGVAVFRPVEIVTLRSADGAARLLYAGCATFWDPSPDDWANIRDVARRLAIHLRDHVAYRGAFSLDGILGEDGFVATELNPRVGAGFNLIASRVSELPLVLLHYAVVAGEPWDLYPAVLEELVVKESDARRGGGGWVTITERRRETERFHLVGDEAGYRLAGPGDRVDGRLSIGPSAVGGFVSFEADADKTPTGPSIAPRVVAAFEAADRLAGIAIGPLAPAQDVRVG